MHDTRGGEWSPLGRSEVAAQQARARASRVPLYGVKLVPSSHKLPDHTLPTRAES